METKGLKFYYLFFILMAFAKGVGLDSGDKLYYLLSAAAGVCLLIKLVLTKYSLRELAVTAALLVAAFIAWRSSGRLGLLLSVMALAGMKGVDVRSLFRLGLIVFGLSFIGLTLSSLTGGVASGVIGGPMAVHLKGGEEVIRWGLGYSTANVLHETYFVLAAFLVYCLDKRYCWKHGLFLMAGNLLVMAYTLSYTGFIVTSFYLAASLYFVGRKNPSTAERILFQLPLPACVVFSLAAPFLLHLPAAARLDAALQARLSFSRYYLANQPITLLGGRMKNVPYSWVIMDNSYVYLLMTFGVLFFVLFCAGYAVLIGRYSFVGRKERGTGWAKGPELAMIYSFLLYGIMEQFLTNAFLNISLFFLAELIWGRTESEAEGLGAGGKEAEGRTKAVEAFLQSWRERCRRRKRWFLPLSALFGAAGLLAYMVVGPRPEAIPVPLAALPYVDADSVLIHVEGTDGTKDGLKAVMNRYAEDVRGRADEETAAMLEFSLPQEVQRSREYETFRVRLLHLRDDWSGQEYETRLEELTRYAENFAAGGELRLAGQEIIQVRIDKDSGEERMEHISDIGQFTAWKGGTIREAELWRGGLASWIFGFLAGGLVWLCVLGLKGKTTLSPSDGG